MILCFRSVTSDAKRTLEHHQHVHFVEAFIDHRQAPPQKTNVPSLIGHDTVPIILFFFSLQCDIIMTLVSRIILQLDGC